MADDGAAELERRLAEALRREAAGAAEAAALRAELARLRRHEDAGPRAGPRAGRLLLQYQLPTLILVVLALPVPIVMIVLVPVPAILLIAGVTGLLLERRVARRADAPDLARTLLRHQACAALLLQPYIALVAYWLATMRLYRGPTPLRTDDFLISLAIGEAAYVLAVFLPLLWVARGAHAQHVGRRVVGLPAT
ncbi:MAG: hypothetical protein JNL82_28240 [Myxococcales bacterium]|nr:hypothetical protein [Myxococcales bacterium]